MKKIKNYEDFINEEINWKSIVPAIALATTLNLSSCKTKEEVENKIPEVELFIQKHIDNRTEPLHTGTYYSGWSYNHDKDTLIKSERLNPEDMWTDSDVDITFDKIVEIREIEPNRLVKVNKDAKFYFIISMIRIDDGFSWRNKYLVDVYCELPDNTGGVIHDLFFADDKQELEHQLESYSSNWCMSKKH